MDEELKELLEKNLEISEETLRILKKMRRGRMIGGILVFFKWVIIIGLSAGAYYYAEPYIKNIIGGLDKTMSQINELQNGNIPPELIKQFQKLAPK